MRKAIFLSTLALLMTAVAVSLSAGTNGDHKENFAKMKTELNLTDAQVSELERKFAEIRPQGEDLERRYKAIKGEIETLEHATPPDEQAIQDKRSQLETLTREWHEKTAAIFRSVLTQEQLTKLDQMHSKKEHEEREEREKQEKEHHDRMI